MFKPYKIMVPTIYMLLYFVCLANCSGSFLAIGGKKFGAKGTKAGSKSGVKQDGGPKRLQQYHHFGKFASRLFPDNDGSVFYTGKKTEKEYLAPKHLVKTVLAPEMQAMMHHLGYGLSETAAMLDLIPWLQRCAGGSDTTAMLNLFADEDGENVLKAIF